MSSTVPLEAPTLATFLATFAESPDRGAPDAASLDVVRNEIVAFWKTPESSLNPVEIFNHLMEARQKADLIKPARAEFLKSYFAESFEPEPTTGYSLKHREPLIRELVDLYAETNPATPVYRIDADIINLGGLNRDLTAIKPEYKYVADAVIRLMANVLRKHIEKLSDDPKRDICTIRSGGDELGILLRGTNPRVSTWSIDKAIEAAQREIAIVVANTGLTEVKHTKADKPPGVGIGCATIRLEAGETKTARDDVLQSRIIDSKLLFQDKFIGPGVNKPMDVRALISLFEHEEYEAYRYPPAEKGSILRVQREYVGKNPELARSFRVHRHLQHVDPAVLTDRERVLLNMTTALTVKRDHVTNLPMFRDMKRDLIPNFLKNFGHGSRKIMLVHFDFNSMGGGNAIGPWVGDAMGKLYSACIERALVDCQFKDYKPYLTAQGGGKFAMLLPCDITQLKIVGIQTAVERKLNAVWNERLPLTEEQLAKSRILMLKRPDFYPNAATMDAITLGDVCSSKPPHYKTAHVMGSFVEIEGDRPRLGTAIETLEKEVARARSKEDDVVRSRGTMVRAFVPVRPGAELDFWVVPTLAGGTGSR